MRNASRAYRVFLAFFRLICSAFFRTVVVTGREHIPDDRGGIVVSWHPNGLVDPGLILTQFPHPIVFGARHGIFKTPILGSIMRAIGTVPIYRAVDLKNADPAERRQANLKSLRALAERIAEGSFSALFPEGLSHDAPHLLELKTGAARLYYQARALQPADAPPAVIIPVGLHYDDKDIFRSRALVEFFPPLELDPVLEYDPDADDEKQQRQARALTAAIEKTLHDVVLATESWEIHDLMHRARKLVRAERAHRAGVDPGRTGIDERVLGFARVRTGYDVMLERAPEQTEALKLRVDEYDADLRALHLEDYELDRAPRLASPWLGLLLLLQVLAVYLLVPPVLVIGYLVNAPAALLSLLACHLFAKEKKDEATIKLLLGALLFPLSWIGAGIAAGMGLLALHTAFPFIPETPWLAGLIVAALGALGGVLALRYLRVARETARAVRVRLTRKLRARTIDRLRRERAELHDALIAASQGLDLPGTVMADGRVARSEAS